MRGKTVIIAILTAATVLVWIVAGCGGGAGGGLQPNRGGVTGRIVDVVSLQGIGNMTVTIGGQPGVSQTPDGSFIVSNIIPGNHQIVVTPTALFVPVPGPPMYVSVQADTYTNLPGPIYVIDPNYLPPSQ